MIVTILSSLLLAAHFLRSSSAELFLFSLAAPLLLLTKKRWAVVVLSLFLLSGALVWIHSTCLMIQERLTNDLPYQSMVIIMASVTAITLSSAIKIFDLRKLDRYKSQNTEWQSFTAFLITFILIAAAHLKMKFPVLILERFFPGTAFIEIIILSSYAAWLTEKMITAKNTSLLRSRIWAAFSIVFFCQFFLGLAGADIFFMTGKLHLPVPALIIGGPLFRGEGLFMPVLFTATVLLVGPAWCSHLCYVGAWDNILSKNRKQPGELKPWMKKSRIFILLSVIATALIFRFLNIPVFYASLTAMAFGLIGIAVMVFLSRKSGIMVHCIAYCPIGLVSNILGKISSFRIRINDSCINCGECMKSCRYGALARTDIQKGKPGITCTLCGDCIGSCKNNSIGYKFFTLNHTAARELFIIIIVSIHTVFLGLARI